MSNREKSIDTLIILVAVLMVLYHLINCYYSFFGSIQNRIVHLCFALVIIILVASRARKWLGPAATIPLVLGTLFVCGYIWIELGRLLQYMGFPTLLEVVVGYVVLAIVLLASYLAVGWILCAVVIGILLYAFWGHYLGGAFLSGDEIITTAVLNFGSYGMFGSILNISASTIFLYIVFGGLLQALRGTDFIFELGKGLGRITRSGPAMTAIVASALMGMTTGQTTPNIAVTGSFTIPLMKRAGYKPEVAGAIEAAASGGGQITPPIMGAGAFVMADLINLPYFAVLKMAIIPAALYYASLLMFVHFQALKSGIMPPVESVNMKRVRATAPLFVLPLGTILVLLFKGYPPGIGAFWGIVVLVGLAFLRKETRPSLMTLTQGMTTGAKIGSTVAVAIASIGPAISLMTKTGLGLTIGYSVERWAGGNAFLGLFILMWATIILGMELPTVAAYLIAAVVAIPPLVSMGVNVYCAHMFTFFFSSFSALTPPIGMAAVVASRLADANYIKTAFHAMAAAIAAYFLPYIFAVNEHLLLIDFNLLPFFALLALVGLGLLTFQMGFVGYLVREFSLWERGLALLCAVCIFIFLISKAHAILLLFSILCFLPVAARQMFYFRKGRIAESG